MCKECVDIVYELFPEAKDDNEKLHFLLWECSPFPFGQPADVRHCLTKYKNGKSLEPTLNNPTEKQG